MPIYRVGLGGWPSGSKDDRDRVRFSSPSLAIWEEIQSQFLKDPNSLCRENPTPQFSKPQSTLVAFWVVRINSWVTWYHRPGRSPSLWIISDLRNGTTSVSLLQYPLRQCPVPHRCSKCNCQMSKWVYLTHSWNYSIGMDLLLRSHHPPRPSVA